MKKLLALLAAAALVLAGTTPAKADVTYYDSFQWWQFPQSPTSTSLSVTGSIREGGTYQVVASGTTPNNETCGVMIKELAGSTVVGGGTDHAGAFSVATGNRIAGTQGSSEQFGLHISCGSGSFSGRFMIVTFDSVVGSPTNFTVVPQGNGTAQVSWGAAEGATSYAVEVRASDNSPAGDCRVDTFSCTITGLTEGATYTFSIIAGAGNLVGARVTGSPLVLRQPVQVAATVSASTWKVGETVSANVLAQGSPTPTVAITWYRCSTAIAASQTAPTGCTQLQTGTSANYTLTAADAGNFVSAYVYASNQYLNAGQTAASSTAVLAADAVAPAPVADPGGKPTVVNIANPIVSVAGGTEVTITGTGLASVTGVTVGGLAAIVVSKSDKSVVIKVPVSTKTGLADLIITNDKGSVTSSSAIIYANNPVVSVTKTKTITGFTSGQKTLTAAQKTAVKALITANPTLTTLACAAKTTGVASNKTELAKAKTLATATCAYAKTLKKTLIVSSTASQTLPKSKASRTVALTLKN